MFSIFIKDATAASSPKNMSQLARRFLPYIVTAQVLLVPLHIVSTDLIDENIRLGALSIGTRLAVIPLFLLGYFFVKPDIEKRFESYLAYSYLVNALGDIYLTSICEAEYLTPHLFGLTAVFIGYSLIPFWKPAKFRLSVLLSLVAGAALFHLNSPVTPLQFMANGGAFMLFIILLSFIFSELRYRSLTVQMDRLQEIQVKNNALLASEEELKQNLEELAASEDNLRLQKKNVEQALHKLHSTQQKLVKAERLASVGKMTNGIAHEINNPLNFIAGGLQSMQVFMADFMEMAEIIERVDVQGTPAQKEELLNRVAAIKEEADLGEFCKDLEVLMRDMEIGVDRISNVVDGLRLFAGSAEAQESVASIHKVLDDAVMATYHQKQSCIIAKEYGCTEEMIPCYPAQLVQAFKSMLSNSVDASGPRTPIVLSTQDAGAYVKVCVADQGIGMSPEVLAKCFEPFFTNKSVGDGLGLGLSVAHGIVEKHAGKVEVESEEGVGTTLSVWLPRKMPHS